jgi:hypothetical protein
MITKTLYRYDNGEGIVYSLVPPENQTEYTEHYRLIADEGKILTKDEENFHSVIDIDKEELSLWKEIDKPETLGLW